VGVGASGVRPRDLGCAYFSCPRELFKPTSVPSPLYPNSESGFAHEVMSALGIKSRHVQRKNPCPLWTKKAPWLSNRSIGSRADMLDARCPRRAHRPAIASIVSALVTMSALIEKFRQTLGASVSAEALSRSSWLLLFHHRCLDEGGPRYRKPAEGASAAPGRATPYQRQPHRRIRRLFVSIH